NTYFNNRSGIAKSLYRFHNRGVAIGGPIMIPKVFNTSRQKLFFFFNFDSNPSKSAGSTPAVQTLPTALERAGDFSQSLNPGGALILVRDPLSGANFPGNIIPQNRINKNGLALLNTMPLPNQFNRTLTLGAYNNQFLRPTPTTRRQYLFRVDYRASDKDSFYFRGMHFKVLNIGGSLTNFTGPNNTFGVPS